MQINLTRSTIIPNNAHSFTSSQPHNPTCALTTQLHPSPAACRSICGLHTPLRASQMGSMRCSPSCNLPPLSTASPGEGGRQRSTYHSGTSWHACQSGFHPNCTGEERGGEGRGGCGVRVAWSISAASSVKCQTPSPHSTPTAHTHPPSPHPLPHTHPNPPPHTHPHPHPRILTIHGPARPACTTSSQRTIPGQQYNPR